MNEELIQQIVSRILSEPAFQALLHGNTAGNLEKRVKPDGIVLLNYVPDFERVLTTVKQQFGANYTLSILPSDQTFVAKPDLPEGMSWITPQDALSKTTWGKIILPACSPNTLAKAALGIRDNPISEIIGRGIAQGISTLLVTDSLGLTAQTPKAYQELYEGYLKTVQSYGVEVTATLEEGHTLINEKVREASVEVLTIDKGPVQPAQGPAVTQASQLHRTNLYEQRLATSEPSKATREQKNTSDDPSAAIREEIRFDKKFLGDKQVYLLPEGSIVFVKRGTVISPLARDTLKSRRIELCVEMEGGRP